MAQLTEDQIAQLKTRLQDLYKKLWDEVRVELERSGNEGYAELAGPTPDPGDSSVADMLADLDIGLADRQMSEMREVEAALKRVADLDFGDCAQCGDEIGYERLMAYPTAQRCVRCQQLHEKTYAHENKPTL
jgi:DnaK suppressor protein